LKMLKMTVTEMLEETAWPFRVAGLKVQP